MQNIKEAYWRKEGYKRFSIFLIRFVETVLMSVIPSVISVFLIIISQDPNGRAWKVLQFLSFFIFITGNCYFYVRFAISRRSKKEFYMINGATYALFVIITYIAYRYSEDVMFCSLTFATLRGFEGFGATTQTSLLISHIVMICLMIMCELITSWVVRLRDEAEYEKILEGQILVEEIPEDELVTVQNNREVRILSPEEMDEYIQQESKEDEVVVNTDYQEMPEGVVEEGFYKGRGEVVTFVNPETFDEPIDETIFSGNMGVNENAMYSSDSLWEKTIYQGRNTDNIPEQVYEPEDDEPVTEVEEDDKQIEAVLIQNLELMDEEDFYDEFDIHEKLAEDISYTSDELWEQNFYQGRDRKVVPEKAKELDDSDGEDWEDFVEEVVDEENESLWDGITRQGEKVKAIEAVEEIAEEFAEELDQDEWQKPEIDDPEYDYDSDNLWGNITQAGRTVKDIGEEESYDGAFETYDSENLWDNVVQGDGTADQDFWLEEVLDADANPYEDYDSDSLWSSDIHQGRKTDK